MTVGIKRNTVMRRSHVRIVQLRCCHSNPAESIEHRRAQNCHDSWPRPKPRSLSLITLCGRFLEEPSDRPHGPHAVSTFQCLY
ncbi:hypothetical protein CPB85DRAFT_1302288 [Mucidula mucida]|nr:hypothetical protein CPB85DRAFT_1336596 [Mucidula mucida]KAF8912268.1 hypothetical protein CPB85DRAFT_1302195 [Mucidula mucida]KAF8912282.1 hypothetical protein CPB85DRAFT_1302288 [Mucidula mucida]